MSKRTNTIRRVFATIIVVQCLLFVAAASAQSISLTPEQQRLINQLPPAQRLLAMEIFLQAQGGQAQSPI